jgi:hypothetical protein
LRVIARARRQFEVIDFPFSSGVALVRVLPRPWWRRAD